MSKQKKPKRKGGDTTKASQRIFYRRPRDMFAEFMWSGPGFVFAVLVFGAHVIFIHMFG